MKLKFSIFSPTLSILNIHCITETRQGTHNMSGWKIRYLNNVYNLGSVSSNILNDFLLNAKDQLNDTHLSLKRKLTDLMKFWR